MPILLGVVLYGIAITKAARPSEPKPPLDEVVSLDGIVIDASDNSGIARAHITAIGSTTPAVSDSNGEFHLEIRSVSAGKVIDLRVSKEGYDAVDWKVTLPIHGGVTVPLSKSSKH